MNQSHYTRTYSRILSGNRLQPLILPLLLLLPAVLIVSCTGTSETYKTITGSIPPRPDPESYLCYRINTPLTIDGIADEPDWLSVPWSNHFVDIEGSVKPEPPLSTRVKMLWDDHYLYIAAELEEPHVWATLRQRDTIIYHDNDFEVFIDPDGDTHLYYEIEVNALGTVMDLLMTRPYRDGGTYLLNWDIHGLRVAVHVDGTINDPSDTDTGWSVEMAVPLEDLAESLPWRRLPVAGDQWRLNFSRVQWNSVVSEGGYSKMTDPDTGRPLPEENWVWSPQGRINMHMPEMWGYLQFSSLSAGEGPGTIVPDIDACQKWALRTVYYYQREYYLKNGKYAPDLRRLGLKKRDFPSLNTPPVIEATASAWESYLLDSDGSQGLTIRHDGHISRPVSMRR